MISKRNSILLWILAVIFTLSAAIYQRATGPTYPQKAEIELNNKIYKFKLLTTFGGESDAPISLDVPSNVKGMVKYRPYRSNAKWKGLEMKHNGESLEAFLPNQPPAGKLEYMVSLEFEGEHYGLNEDPVVIRFKGAVPGIILVPHVILMFLAMLYSTRTGIEALGKGHRTYSYTIITLITLGIGGMILGPVVQLYAFGDLWTGWPFGGDWTDNKTLFAFVFWVIAFFVLRKNKKNRVWPIIAFIVLLAIYMIPHSMGGSELDYETGKVTTGLKE
ncbi:MAG: hypothetical protein PF484_00125 [Bacteroidales bacterium]|jgi:hypothetical protein|nr:hypothetical protein [Bacteroidales bacterium]